MVIRISAHKGKVKALTLEIEVDNGKVTKGDPVYLGSAPAADSLPTSISIGNPSPLRLRIGAAATVLSASILPANALQTVIWTLDSSAVAAIVDGNQIKGLKAGSAALTAASKAKAAIFTRITVIVDTLAAKPQAITLSMPTPMILSVGCDDGDLIGRITPDGVSQEIPWSSFDPATAQITAANRAKALKTGKATLTAKAKADTSIAISFEAEVIVPVKVDGITSPPPACPSIREATTGGNRIHGHHRYRRPL